MDKNQGLRINIYNINKIYILGIFNNFSINMFLGWLQIFYFSNQFRVTLNITIFMYLLLLNPYHYLQLL